MPTEIYLVKVGMTMTEGIVDEWYIADGDPVEQGQPVYRLETEKVNLDVEADVSGIVKHIAQVGETLAPGDVVGWIYAADETIPDELPTPKANPNIVALDESAESGVTATKVVSEEKPSTTRVKASPAARRLAEELNVDLSQIEGTGPGGRITKDDVTNAAEAPSGGGASEGSVDISLKGMRKVIADRMYESLQTTAQLTIEMEVRMDDAIKLRTALLDEWESSGIRVTYTDLVVSACVKALQGHPMMNSTLVDGVIHSNPSVHMGIAVALDEGLIVPVLHDADAKSLKECAAEAATLAERARTGKLMLDEVSGGTFTVTSLGMYGVDTFTPILNSPQTGILGVGRIYDGVRWVDDHATRTQNLRLSLTWDHRVIDGAPAAEFLRDVKDQLESPYRLILQ
ncbi:MAG: dihydrolipoamide acetyltransferase family protein [Gammaproteobacteria bacterium]|nr:dihydrolipoamide acetyltransferase family protein [Gammaproteobacteria bacterium]